jgi:hypothetical protein
VSDLEQRIARAGCTDKRCFSGRKLALAAASDRQRESGEPWEAYHCDLHHAWHIGHPKGWRRSHGARGIARGERSAEYEAVPDGQGGLILIRRGEALTP